MTKEERREARLAYAKQYRQNNKEKVREGQYKARARNPEKYRVIRARWRAKNKEKTRETRLMQQFNLTLDQWEQMFEAQEKKCKICYSNAPNSKTGWHTDHCHKTKKVRGILCHNCNHLLGTANDSIEILRAAIEYLQCQ